MSDPSPGIASFRAALAWIEASESVAARERERQWGGGESDTGKAYVLA